MSFELIGLRKLLTAMYASNSRRVSMLREDIRNEIKKAQGYEGDGGDFYVPFWADAKRHVLGDVDLRIATANRITRGKGRERLYNLLRDGFLLWWEERRRLRNERFRVIEGQIKARYPLDGLGVIKVENTLCITIGDVGHRIVYPYFSEEPPLSDEAARLGIWVMSNCIKGYAIEDMRILDVMRGQSFSVLDTPLLGDEETIFRFKYSAILEEWRRLRSEYG